MNLEARTAKDATLAPDLDPEGGSPDLAHGTGARGAGRGDALALAAGGDQRALAGDAAAPEIANAPEAEIEKRTKEGNDLGHHLKATAQPDGHAAPVGGAGEVAAEADPPESLPRGRHPGLPLLEDTRRRRNGIRTGTGSGAATKIVAVTTGSTPAARRRGAGTRTAIRRGS